MARDPDKGGLDKRGLTVVGNSLIFPHRPLPLCLFFSVPQYCEFTADYEKCKEWWKVNEPDSYTRVIEQGKGRTCLYIVLPISSFSLKYELAWLHRCHH